jgi:hypothetical protein
MQSRGRAALQRRVKRETGKGTTSVVPHECPKRTAASAAEVCLPLAHSARCHPERSMRIRPTNPHAQSKDPYPSTMSQPPQGVSPHHRLWEEHDRKGHELHSANRVARVERTLLSAAFDVDLDFDFNLDFDFDPLESCTEPVRSRGRAALQRRVKRINEELGFSRRGTLNRAVVLSEARGFAPRIRMRSRRTSTLLQRQTTH